VSSLKVTDNTLDLALLRERHSHVQTQSDYVAIEILDCQHSPELIYVTALHSNPTPKCDGLRINAGTAGVAEECDECHFTSTRLVEARGFGSAGINSGNR